MENFRIYNTNKGHMHVGFQPHLNIRYKLALGVGWVEGQNPTSKHLLSTQPTTGLGGNLSLV